MAIVEWGPCAQCSTTATCDEQEWPDRWLCVEDVAAISWFCSPACLVRYLFGLSPAAREAQGSTADRLRADGEPIRD